MDALLPQCQRVGRAYIDAEVAPAAAAIVDAGDAGTFVARVALLSDGDHVDGIVHADILTIGASDAGGEVVDVKSAIIRGDGFGLSWVADGLGVLENLADGTEGYDDPSEINVSEWHGLPLYLRWANAQ